MLFSLIASLTLQLFFLAPVYPQIPAEILRHEFLRKGRCFPNARKIDAHDTCLQLGTNYGSFYLPVPWQEFLPSGGVHYGFGCGEDISFDVALAALFPNATFRIFDPTPRAIDHVNAVFRTIETGIIPPFAPSGRRNYFLHSDNEEHEISGSYDARHYFENIKAFMVGMRTITHKPYALSTEDKILHFSAPSTKSSVSHYIGKNDSVGIDVSGRTLDSVMRELGDSKIDVLKCDIEGAEVELIPYLVKLFRQWDKYKWPQFLLFDMDSLRQSHRRFNPIDAKNAMSMLREIGYERYAQSNADICWKLILR